ncbi:uncharacterized protein ACA1_054400 [Acanthamoeba castellanii str. Neff]|uniref:RFX-type winged-helix domain-containing protein n=1 Tax=Acanthamoeba castellanii (strain ATCC 30010 / Neff) TaxID=1257118 RepID=L8H5B5_ACACF|nr:uncharacterized protein ACA1_054400 [Acanthamoeba castellanii str. Neff]ELR20694.1 hypothetical protein ACA1_054400 [Acanthamoeba castellanii str. Neff]
MTKEEIFADYLRMCENDHKAPLMASMFGKLVHRAFPGLRSSRLGARGQSKHCYKCLRRRSPTTTTANPPPSSRSTATATSRPRSATYPTSSTAPTSSVGHSLSSTILATVAHRRSRDKEEAPEKKPAEPRRDQLSTSSPWPATTCTTNSSTPPTSPTSSYYLGSLGSTSSPRTTCGSSPPRLVDVNWRPQIQPTGPVKSEGSSPLLHYAAQTNASFVHPLGFANHQSACEHSAHSSSSALADVGVGQHADQLTRMDPPAYISPLEVDYFQLSDLSDFCPSPTLTTPTSVAPSTTTPTSTTSASSWSSGVDDIERFRSFLTGLAHGDIGLPGEDYRNFGASTSPDLLFRQYRRLDSAGSSPVATHMWLHPGLSLDTSHHGVM